MPNASGLIAANQHIVSGRSASSSYEHWSGKSLACGQSNLAPNSITHIVQGMGANLVQMEKDQHPWPAVAAFIWSNCKTLNVRVPLACHSEKNLLLVISIENLRRFSFANSTIYMALNAVSCVKQLATIGLLAIGSLLRQVQHKFTRLTRALQGRFGMRNRVTDHHSNESARKCDMQTYQAAEI